MTPDEFVTTAQKLLVQPCTEGDKRSAISRSYYGAFHGCMESLPDEYTPEPSELKSAESHKVVIDAVAKWGKGLRPGRTDAQQAARKLASLKKARRQADYELSSKLDEEACNSCVKNAGAVLQLIRSARSLYDQARAA